MVTIAASTRDKMTAARVLRAAGHSVELICELLDVTKSTVYRWLADMPPDDPGGSALDDLEALLASQELDGHGRFNAGVARRLAMRLDKVAMSDKAQDAVAMPQIAKELRAVVDEIMKVSNDDMQWLINVFTPPSNGHDAG